MSASSPASMNLNPPELFETVGSILMWIERQYGCEQWGADGEDPVFDQAQINGVYLPWADHTFQSFVMGLRGQPEPSTAHESHLCQLNFLFGLAMRNRCVHRVDLKDRLGPPIESVRFVSFKAYETWQTLVEHDLRLTMHQGISLYTKEESLHEIERHHRPASSGQDFIDLDFTDLMNAIRELPDDMLIEW